MYKAMVLTVGVLVLGAGVCLAQEANTPPAEVAVVEVGQAVPVEVGNKICPVSNEEVGKMGPAVPIEYNGKTYNLCCSMCAKDFNNDPAKFSKIAEDEVANAAAETSNVN